MAIRMTYITYTAEAHRAIIEGRQNREPVMRALIEDEIRFARQRQ